MSIFDVGVPVGDDVGEGVVVSDRIAVGVGVGVAVDVGVGVAVGTGVGVSVGVGVGIGAVPVIMSVTFTVCAVPADGVIVIVAGYDPADIFVVSTENAIVDDAPAASVPLVGLADNQLTDEEPTVHCNPSPPVFVMVIDCESGLLPRGVENVKLFVFKFIAGAATLIVRAIVAGLPRD
jgi:hypothetical protein